MTSEDVQRLKARLEKKAAKTVNNVLTVLSVTLRKAVEWGVIERMPCTIKLLKVSKRAVSFYDFDEYERLVEAAKATGVVEYGSSCWPVKRACGQAKSSRWSGATWTCQSASCAFNGTNGRARRTRPRADDFAMFR